MLFLNKVSANKWRQLFRGTLLLIFLFFTSQAIQAQLNEPILKETCEYESHKLGGNGFPFHDAVNFKGKVYAVQIYNAARGTVRVCALDYEANTGKIKFGSATNVTSGGIYTDSELIEWKGKLVVFWKNNTTGHIVLNYSDDGKTFLDKGITVHKDPTFSDFAVVKYKDKLCLLYHEKLPLSDETSIYDTKGKIYIKYTEDVNLSNASWKNYGTVKNSNQDNILFKGNKTISPNHTSSSRADAWDAESWIGNNANGENSEMLVVGRVKNEGKSQGKFEAFNYEGNLGEKSNDAWNPYIAQDGSCLNAFYLKLVQASVKGVTSVNTMPIQFIYATDQNKVVGEVFFKEFLPSNKVFSSTSQKYCDIPYGYFGVATSNLLLEDKLSDPTDPHRLYRQKLHLIRGNGPGYHYSDNYALSLSSNLIKTKSLSMKNSIDLFSEEKLRPLITFEGIVEGPPPTIVNSDEWYKKLFDYFTNQYSASSITLGHSEEECHSEKWGGGIAAKVGIGPNIEGIKTRFCMDLKLAGYDEKQVSHKVSYEYQDFAADVNRLQATAFYTVPNIVRYDYEVWNCDKIDGRINSVCPMVDFRIMSYTMVPIPVSLSEAPFNIKDPSNLQCWNKRTCLVGAENIPTHQKLNMGFKINTGNQTAQIEKSTTITSSFSASFEIGTDIDLPFFSLDFMGGFNYEYITTNTIAKSLSYTLNAVPLSTVPAGITPISNYLLSLYVLTHESSDLLDRYYYPEMKKKKLHYGNHDFSMLVEGEKPFVIAWEANPFLFFKQKTNSPKMPLGKKGKLPLPKK